MPLLSQPSQPAQSSPPDTVTLRIIVANSADDARRIIDRLNRDENFVALAEAESIDPSAAAGGFLGKIALSSLRPDLRDALQGLKAGQLTPVVQIPTGFAILKLVEDADPANTKAVNPSRIPALAATGIVNYLTQIGGFSEAETVLQGLPKPADWNHRAQIVRNFASELYTTIERLTLDVDQVLPSTGRRLRSRISEGHREETFHRQLR